MSLCHTYNIKVHLWVNSTHKYAIAYKTTSETTNFIVLRQVDSPETNSFHFLCSQTNDQGS